MSPETELSPIIHSRFFIVSGGKTGSSTLTASFNSAFHSHGCIEFRYVYPKLSSYCLHDLYTYAQKHYVNPTENERVVILSSVRDPIARTISSFFQNITDHLGKTESEILAMPVVDLITIFNEKFFFILEDYYSFWDLEEPLGNCYAGRDLLLIPFDHQKRCLYYQDNGYRILILRFEDISEWDQIIRATLPKVDLRTYSFQNENLSKDKWYAPLYRQFLHEYTVRRDLLDIKFNHPSNHAVLMHFYTPMEIEKIKERWYTRAV